MQVHIAPQYTKSIKSGIFNYLDQLINKFLPELNGVVLGYSGLKLLSNQAVLTSESPYMHFNIRITFLVFGPKEEEILVGVVNRVSPDHIGLLVHGFFNASIAKTQFEENTLEYTDDCWQSNDGKCKIEQGTIVKFRVLELFTNGDFLTLQGSLIPLHKEDNIGVIISSKLTAQPSSTPILEDEVHDYEFEKGEVDIYADEDSLLPTLTIDHDKVVEAMDIDDDDSSEVATSIDEPVIIEKKEPIIKKEKEPSKSKRPHSDVDEPVKVEKMEPKKKMGAVKEKVSKALKSVKDSIKESAAKLAKVVVNVRDKKTLKKADLKDAVESPAKTSKKRKSDPGESDKETKKAKR